MEEIPDPGVLEFAERLKQEGVRRVLDLGCGDGRHLIFLAKQGFMPSGVDNAFWGVRRAGEWAGREGLNVELACADVRSLPWADESFDSVISNQVIHHQLLDAIRETILSVKRILRANGLFYFTVPKYPPGNWKDGKYTEVEKHTYAAWDGFEKDVPHHLFTIRELSSMLKNDFEVLEVKSDSGRQISALVRKPK
jgi:SAM-dependent methyltransferase